MNIVGGARCGSVWLIGLHRSKPLKPAVMMRSVEPKSQPFFRVFVLRGRLLGVWVAVLSVD